MSEDEEVQAVVAEPEKPVAKPQFRSRSVEVKSPLAEKLWRLMCKDIDRVYNAILEDALGISENIPRQSDGKPARSAGTYILGNRRLLLSYMKIINTNFKVDSRDIQADLDNFRTTLIEEISRSDITKAQLEKTLSTIDKDDDDGSD